eukprot:TRINITY_DN23834_c0_g1_i1.p1 TRINITY_DN23834_c0_g1~~TRINITY_DN23834_c0_g1_i1.p1  ORF type:complete len:202 (+),score=42.32 TRINITY_DN23834_c0_g1_i1:208-813(+)
MMNCDDLISRNDHVEFEWFPFTNAVLTRQLNRTTVFASIPTGAKAWYSGCLKKQVMWWVCTLGGIMPRMAPWLWKFYARRLRHGVNDSVDRSDRQFMVGELRGLGLGYHEMEYAVALPDARAAVAELRRYMEQHVLQGYYLSLPIAIRFAAMDHSYLSPCYMRTSCYITVRAPINNPSSIGFLSGLGELWHRFGGLSLIHI